MPSQDGPEHPGLAHVDAFVEQLEEYFAGTRWSFALVLDLTPAFVSEDGKVRANPWISPSAVFRTRAQVALQGIPFGRTTTYGALAKKLGSPRAARAVGTACATNPLPVVLPCHRVTPASGGIGSYTGGVAIKEALLQHERDTPVSR